MTPKLIFIGEVGDRIDSFITKVIESRPNDTNCYFVFNDRYVKVGPLDNYATLYQRWLDAGAK